MTFYGVEWSTLECTGKTGVEWSKADVDVDVGSDAVADVDVDIVVIATFAAVVIVAYRCRPVWPS